MKRGHTSPWIVQLQKDHYSAILSKDSETDITIIGAGIAGISTVYFLLKSTKFRVVVLEGYKIAHGATGHNAGQIASYFEKPFKELVKEYGLQKAASGQKDVLSAWNLLEGIYDETGLQVPFYQFIGYAGCSSYKQVLLHLENIYLMKKGGISVESLLISENAPYLKKISKKYKDCYGIISQEKLLSLLETNNKKYTAALTSRKGCLNSALFCEELLKFMQRKYGKRLQVFEHSPAQSIHLWKDYALIISNDHLLRTKKIVLCTNGFENINIVNRHGRDIDMKFHKFVHGIIGYMRGYFGDVGKCPAAISYFAKNTTSQDEPYFYITKRYYELNKKNRILLCVGGPDMKLKDTSAYSAKQNYLPKAGKIIDAFLRSQYPHANKLHDKFTWHGLMGYTSSGIRCIGEEPANKILLYNLGCNGVGILPSIFGGKKISLIIQGKKLKPSIFDPK